MAAQQPTAKPALPKPKATVSPPFRPVATIKDIMDALIDPQSDVIFEAVATILTKAGTEERAPRTDADWEAVRTGALLLSEGAHLLMVQGRHVAGPGARSEVPGVELEPAEMEALINKNFDLFRKHAQGLVNVVTIALRAMRKAASHNSVRKLAGKFAAGATSTTFWWRRCTEQSRSQRCSKLP